MPKSIITVDLNKPGREQTPRPHNRWHPDIPVVASVKPGDRSISSNGSVPTVCHWTRVAATCSHTCVSTILTFGRRRARKPGNP